MENVFEPSTRLLDEVIAQGGLAKDFDGSFPTEEAFELTPHGQEILMNSAWELTALYSFLRGPPERPNRAAWLGPDLCR